MKCIIGGRKEPDLNFYYPKTKNLTHNPTVTNVTFNIFG